MTNSFQTSISKVYFSEVYFSKVYFCKVYPTCASSKLCNFLSLRIHECGESNVLEEVFMMDRCIEPDFATNPF